MRASPLRVGVIDVGVMGTDYVERLAQRTAGALRSPTQMRRGPLTGQRPSRDFYAATAVCTAGMASVASGAPSLGMVSRSQSLRAAGESAMSGPLRLPGETSTSPRFHSLSHSACGPGKGESTTVWSGHLSKENYCEHT